MDGFATRFEAGAPTSELAQREGVQKLLSMVDDMRSRPTWRQGDIPLPVVVITGRADNVNEAAAALRNRHYPSPCAYLTVHTAAEGQPDHEVVADLLRQAAEQLEEGAPRGEARIRFPLLNHVLWLVNLPLPEQRTKIHAEVSQAVRERWKWSATGQGWQSRWANVRAYAEGPLASWAALAMLINLGIGTRLGLVQATLATVAAMVLAVLHIARRSRGWAGRLRYRWFRRQPYLWEDHEQIRDRRSAPKHFAVKVVQARHTAKLVRDGNARSAAARNADESQPADTDLVLLLVNAFLEDLRQAYERRIWKIWRRVTWTRTTYPILLLDGECAPLARQFERVRAETATPDPLLMVMAQAGARPPLPGQPDQAAILVDPEDADDAWPSWKACLARDRSIGSRRAITVRINPEHAQLLLRNNSVPRPPRRRPFFARQWVPVAVISSMIAGSLFYIHTATDGMCQPGIKRVETGECIGIGDGFVFDDRLKSVSNDIAENNEKIVNSGSPYVTVMYLGALSVPTDSAAAGDLLADVHGELAGVAVAQRRRIRNSKDRTLLQMRVLLVNAGSEFRFASDAAESMLERIDDDRSIVGVVGANESREQVQVAIGKLSSRSLPVLTTAATFDDLGQVQGEYLPSLFPLAPPNSELAWHAAHWAAAGIPGVFPPLKSAVVFTDATASDLYAIDLGNRFHAAFGPGASKLEFSGADSIQQEVNRICLGAQPKPDLLYYAGRSSQFGEFLDAVSNTCHGITVMAGDAVTQYVNDQTMQLAQETRIRFFYTPLASESSWESVPETHRTSFYHDLEDFTHRLKLDEQSVNRQPSPAYAALANDASEALMQAAQDAYRAQRAAGSEIGLDRSGVLLALHRLAPTNGASGLVKLHGAGNGHHALNRPILLVKIELVITSEGTRAARQRVIAQCGQLYSQQRESKDCPAEPGASLTGPAGAESSRLSPATVSAPRIVHRVDLEAIAPLHDGLDK